MYKYKSANENDMNALKENKLWISTLEYMNDPMDLGFYISRSKHSDESIIHFQEALNKAYVVISLSKTKQNRRLWNYYTDGMKGFVLKYNNDDLKKALKDMGATKIISNSVVYSDKKTDLTSTFTEFCDTGIIPSPKEIGTLFTKDESWRSEDEYRIITRSDFLDKYPGAKERGGICLENVIPTQIVIGYRMNKDKREEIIKHAKMKNIEVRMFIPDFRSESSKEYKSEIVCEKSFISSKEFDEDEDSDSRISDDETMKVR